MNLLNVLCRELGIKEGDEWTGNDNTLYMIEDNMLLEWYQPKIETELDYAGWLMCEPETYKDIMLGKLKPVWKPKRGEMYYTISFFDKDPIELLEWGDTEWDRILLERCLVFETKEEAVEVASTMLNAVQEEY